MFDIHDGGIPPEFPGTAGRRQDDRFALWSDAVRPPSLPRNGRLLPPPSVGRHAIPLSMRGVVSDQLRRIVRLLRVPGRGCRSEVRRGAEGTARGALIAHVRKTGGGSRRRPSYPAACRSKTVRIARKRSARSPGALDLP